MSIFVTVRNIGCHNSARVAGWKLRASTSAFCAALIALFVGSFGLPTIQAQEASNSAPNYNLEGDWVRIDVAGSGDFT
jgi:hypothetical protein